MTRQFKVNSLFALTLFSALASAGTKLNDQRPPEVSAAQLKLSYSEIPYLKSAFIDTSPAQLNDGIPVGELGKDGGNKALLTEFAQDIANYKEGFYDSFLVAQKGKLLFESYYARGRVNLPHYQASATKTYTGLALGRAIQLGYLSMEDLDKPVLQYLKDIDKSKLAKGSEDITIQQALTMTTGIRISEEQWKSFRKLPHQRKGQGDIQTLLEFSQPIAQAANEFEYGTGPQIIMQILEALVPVSAEHFIKTELLDKLGITEYRWMTDAITGLPEAGWRTTMTSRDMLKWGTLAVNRGKWQGEQLISEAFMNKAISRQVNTPNEEIHFGGKDVSNQGYGYFWWSVDLKVGDKTYYSTSARGGNGQFILFIEELDLLIVHTAHDNDTPYLQTLAERVLPAFIN